MDLTVLNYIITSINIDITDLLILPSSAYYYIRCIHIGMTYLYTN